MYAYQLFKAKSSGADAIKLSASILSVQDLSYLIKVAKAFNILCIVVVSSKQQLLSVVQTIPDLQAVSVSSRNMKVWKIDQGKANKILQDPEVVDTIRNKRDTVTTDGKDFLLFQEGFVSAIDLEVAATNGKYRLQWLL